MLLIPEDVYKALLAGSKSTSKDKNALLTPKTNAENTVDFPSDQMMINSRQKLVKIKRTRGANPDARHIKYIQEYKRYKKFADDVASKPVNVHVNNLDQMATAFIKEKNNGKKAKAFKQAVLQNALEFAHNQDLSDNISLPDALPAENAVAVQQSLSTNKNKAINKKQVASPNKISLRSTIQPRKNIIPIKEPIRTAPNGLTEIKLYLKLIQLQVFQVNNRHHSRQQSGTDEDQQEKEKRKTCQQTDTSK